jgi:hypothetical protein
MARFIKNFAHLLRRAVVSALAIAGAAMLPLAPARAQDDPQLLETVRAADMKVADIGWRLASANAALCDRVEAGTGMQLHTLDQFDPESREAARRHFGFASEVAIEGVVPGSPADAAGLKADDSLVRVGSILISGIAGKPASTDRLVAAQLAIAALPPQDAMEIEVIRKGAPIRVTLHPVPICKSRFEMRIADDWGASADGTMVQIGSRFVEEYPENQLASVMAHEFAHNVMRHREKLEARGVDYGMLAGLGRNVKYFRQTELQADLLSVYLLANASYPVRAAIDFWKRFGPSNAGGILRSRSHPAWRDRVATIEAEIARVESVSARPVIPALLADRAVPLSGDWQSLLVRHR